MRLVGGVIGIDFDHVRHLRVGFLFDGIHGEGSRLFCERGADVFVANVVVGGALAVFYAEFKDVKTGAAWALAAVRAVMRMAVFFMGSPWVL